MLLSKIEPGSSFWAYLQANEMLVPVQCWCMDCAADHGHEQQSWPWLWITKMWTINFFQTVYIVYNLICNALCVKQEPPWDRELQVIVELTVQSL